MTRLSRMSADTSGRKSGNSPEVETVYEGTSIPLVLEGGASMLLGYTGRVACIYDTK